MASKKSLNVIQNKPLRLSVSKVKTFKTCKAQYKFNYIDKLKRPAERDYHIFGSFLHEVLERFQLKIIQGSQDPDHVLMKETFNLTYQEWKKKVTSDQKAESYDILICFLKQRADRKKSGKLPSCIAAEKDFSVNLDDKVILNGFIDVVQRDPDDTMHIADYKTSKTTKYLVDDMFQLKTYAYVLCNEDPSIKKIRCSYIMLRLEFEEVVVEFSREEALSMKEEFLKYAEQIQAEKSFKPKVGPLCAYCDFLTACEAGKNKVGINSSFGETDW